MKLLVVLLHELSHATAAVLTGGAVLEINLSPNEGGLTTTAGGWRFLILNAGYLGSLLWGLLFLALARRENRSRSIVALLAIALAAVSLLYVRPLVSFGFAFSALLVAALAGLARFGTAGVAATVLRFVGVFSILYALFDIRDDILTWGKTGLSDAVMLAQHTGIPAMVWGVAWVLAGVAILFVGRKWL
jgi:hypothetical protein